MNVKKSFIVVSMAFVLSSGVSFVVGMEEKNEETQMMTMLVESWKNKHEIITSCRAKAKELNEAVNYTEKDELIASFLPEGTMHSYVPDIKVGISVDLLLQLISGNVPSVEEKMPGDAIQRPASKGPGMCTLY